MRGLLFALLALGLVAVPAAGFQEKDKGKGNQEKLVGIWEAVKGDKEHKETLKIKTLSDKQLVTIDERGTQDEFKRKK